MSAAKHHPRNPHQGRYDFEALVATCADLAGFLQPNKVGEISVDFADPAAVLCLNRALLAQHYGVAQWGLPEGYLCPAVPGRADYVLHLADLLGQRPQAIRALDIGTGASCVYPIIASRGSGWRVVGTDIDPVSIKTAKAIVDSNPGLANGIQLRQQRDKGAIFAGVVRPGERFDVSLCNPPFHASQAQANAANSRKRNNLGQQRRPLRDKLNFGGQGGELWCPGGELGFLKRMATESRTVGEQIGWFSSLLSKGGNIAPLRTELRKLGAAAVEVVPMAQGNKQSRFIAWRFGA